MQTDLTRRTSAPAAPLRIVVAEDSQTAQELLVSILESDPGVRVVGRAGTGREAVELTERLAPDLVTMDIHMPVMDGVEATKEIMVRVPTPIVIVASSASSSDMDRSFHAMRAGALAMIPKPDNPLAPAFAAHRERLLATVKAMAQVKVVRRWSTSRRVADLAAAPAAPASSAVIASLARRSRPGIIAIAASTGGPAALQRILADIPRDFPLPVVLVQHIADGFSGGLCDWLATTCDLRVKVAENGEALDARTVYIAPDGVHCGVTRAGRIALDDAAPVGMHRPSATYLFRSVASAYRARALAVILTGMGRDGVDGLTAVREAGGRIIAQDEATSVVWGMPGETVAAGLADAVLGVHDIGPAIIAMITEEHNARPDR